MANILLVIHVLTAIGIVVLVLLQQGRGADMGAAFGGGSQTLFGARGSATFLSKITTWLAAVFFFTSMGLAYVYTGAIESRSVTEQTAPQTPPAPKPIAQDQDIPVTPGQAGQAGQDTQGDVPPVPIPREPGEADAKVGTESGDPPKSQ